MKNTIFKVLVLSLSLLILVSCGPINPSNLINALKLDKSTLVIEVGQTEKLNLTFESANKEVPEIIWSTSDVKVAEVDNTGLVKAVATGNCVITAKTKNGKLSIASNITVKSKAIKELKIDKGSVSLQVGSTEQLNAIISPPDAEVLGIQWVSSDPKIVSIDNNGLIKALSPGKAKISLITKDGVLSALCFVTINAKSVKGIKLTKTSLTLLAGSYEKLEVVFDPTDVGDRNVTFSSSDTKIATVSSSGSVKAIAPGTAVITVKSQDGGFTTKCNITVTPQPEPPPTTSTQTQFKLLFKRNDTTLMRVYLYYHAGSEDSLGFSRDVEIYLNNSSICIKFNDSMVDEARTGYHFGTGAGVTVKSEATGEILFQRERTDP